MLFNTTQFFVFLSVVLIVFYASPRPWRKFVLLAASYYFYASWNPKFIALLLTLTVIDYSAGLWISRAAPERKKFALILSLSANLGFLGFFKYYNFLAETLVQLLRMPSHAFALDIVLPLGISFHTFQSMSYVVDVYRGEQEAITNPFDYALFICFFPQLVAGPIVRAREFFGDLLQWRPPSGDDVARGIFLLILGLTKKMAFADQFAQVADGYFHNVAGNPGMLTAWTGTFAFAMQIFFDFSGYTDMAIGMAKLIGFHFPVNFRRPYLASSITDCQRESEMCQRRQKSVMLEARYGQTDRISFSSEFPPAVSGFKHYRFLAPLAHFALALAARLSLHPARRKPPRRADDLSQPDAHDAAGRIVARRQLEFCDLGRLSWRSAEH